MEKTAVFPGSFDPITLGHKDIILRAASVFDKIIIAIGYNTTKQSFFTVEQRQQMLQEIFKNNNIEIVVFEGLTVDFCRKVNAKFIVRGIRSASDFDYEKSIAGMNKILYKEVETVVFFSKPEFIPVTSTVVREILRNNGDVSGFVPDEVIRFLNK